MKKPEDFQREYYKKTARLYDDMHVRAGDEHYVALKHILSFVNLLGI